MSEHGDKVRLYAVDGQAIQALCPARVAGAAGDGLVWHRLMPIGTFSGPIRQGTITITDADILQAKANFDANPPTPLGISIGQRADHSKNPEGAFGWVQQMEVRTDGLWGGISWTPLGVQKVESHELPFLSPEFWLAALGGYRYQDWMKAKGTVVSAVALTDTPFFRDQDPVKVRAMAEGDDAEAAQAARSKQWGIEVCAKGQQAVLAAYQAACPNPEDYGDPVNFMYPLKPLGRLRNAAARMAQSFAKYKQEQSRRVVWTRIVRAEKRAGVEHRPNADLDPLLPADLRPKSGNGGAK